METQYSPFEDLHVWQEGMKICEEIYLVMKTCRDYGLRDQMQRASVSICSNIAEGHELGSIRGFIRYLFIAKGSCGELRTQVYIAMRQGYITNEQGAKLINATRMEAGMIYNLIKKKRKSLIDNVLQSIIPFLPLSLMSW